jgi:hypothetical protein
MSNLYRIAEEAAAAASAGPPMGDVRQATVDEPNSVQVMTVALIPVTATAERPLSGNTAAVKADRPLSGIPVVATAECPVAGNPAVATAECPVAGNPSVATVERQLAVIPAAATVERLEAFIPAAATVELGGYVMLILVLCFWKDVETFSVCILNV